MDNINKKKICIITMGNLYLVPYIRTYMKNEANDYSIIYWDRDNKYEASNEDKCYRFSHAFESRTEKVIGYFRYRKFIERIILKENYDVIVMLQTLGALLINDILVKKYRGKYIIDVRDYTYENNRFIYRIEEKLMKHSIMNVVSSEGYLSFLPKEKKYYIAHNMREWPKDRITKIRERNKERKVIHIVFVGYVNYQEQHKKLLLALKDDNRFRFSFIGTRGEELAEFCDKNHINNVRLLGTFESEKTIEFYEDADLVNNLYGNNTPVLDYALSNKLYYSAQFRIPILVCSNTFMEEKIKQYGIGLTVDTEEKDLGDYIYNYYRSIDWESFDKGCEEFWNDSLKQQLKFENQLRTIV